jgi:hypothetical protein
MATGNNTEGREMRIGTDIDTGNRIRATRGEKVVEGFVGAMQYSSETRSVRYFTIRDEKGETLAAIERGEGWRVNVLDDVRRPFKSAPVAPGVCPKCGGTGIIKAFVHIEGGRCFMCNGTGKLGN